MNMYKPLVHSPFGIPNKFDQFDRSVAICIDGFIDTPEFNNSQYKVFIQGCEPPEIYSTSYSIDDITSRSDKFDLVLYSDDTLSSLSNSELFPFGSGWITEDFKNYEKRYEVAFICGRKDWLIGHRLRHDIWARCSEIKNIPIKFYFTVEGKDQTFDTSQFAIVVENTQHKNYFTEKIIDSFMTHTVPLYWGCPNIGEYFNNSGIIKFETLDELLQKLDMLTPDLYNNKLSVIEENYNKAIPYSNFFKRVSNTINRHLNK